MKRRATSYVSNAGMPLEFWYWSACKAVSMYRVMPLGIAIPEHDPNFGHRVLVLRPPVYVEHFG
eukprot:12906116-Prorocentrum_lima.AAC.1